MQAVEKYLKAILLFHDQSTVGFLHHIKKAYNQVLAIKGNRFDFAEGLESFIEYLDNYGNNRYWDYPSQIYGLELRNLDLAV